MHAWVRVWCGATMGWVELDPTNDIPAGLDHIVVGHGRDYSDVAPVVGVLKSYGSHETAQAVDVVPVAERAPAEINGSLRQERRARRCAMRNPAPRESGRADLSGRTGHPESAALLSHLRFFRSFKSFVASL